MFETVMLVGGRRGGKGNCMNGQRIVKLQVDWFLRLHMRCGERKVVGPAPGCDLPPDTRVIRMGHDALGWIYVIVESADWPALKDGDPIPELPSPSLMVLELGRE